MLKRNWKESLAEFEAPKKKLNDEKNTLIKKLAEKQVKTNITLSEHLNKIKEFENAKLHLPITNYHAGECSTKRLQEIETEIDEIENLKAAGLSDDDIQFYSDYKLGFKNLTSKHKFHEKDLLKQRMNNIIETIEKFKAKSVKDNVQNNITHPMDAIKEIESDLFGHKQALQIDISKIRRKARKLGKRLNDEEKQTAINKEVDVDAKDNAGLQTKSKWDLKVADNKCEVPASEVKTYSCQPQKLYTIKNGEIVSLEEAKKINVTNRRISPEEIVKLPKFQNYSVGNPNKVLYIKNLPNKITENDLRGIFSKFSAVTFKIMSGRMRGQAFLTFLNEGSAIEALNELNGLIINDKPMIIQYGNVK